MTELKPKSGFYDFDAKYTDGMTEHVCPAQIPERKSRRCASRSRSRRTACWVAGVCSRTDFRWDEEQGEDGLFVLETNTQPGMTPLSLVPEQAKHIGMEYGELVETIIAAALRHFDRAEGRVRWLRSSARPPGVRRSAAARSRSQKARKARSHTVGVVGRCWRMLPFTEEQLHRFFLCDPCCGRGGWRGALLALPECPHIAGAEFARSAADAGFRVHRIKITGVKRMSEGSVYARVQDQLRSADGAGRSDALRQRLLELPWVSDARVSRQLPDTLLIDIVERVPRAVLVKPDHLELIDGTGHELEPIALAQAKAKGWLMISGPGAQREVTALDQLLDNASALKPQVAAAEWVGNRRWNLTFKTGQLLALARGGGFRARAGAIRQARRDEPADRRQGGGDRHARAGPGGVPLLGRSVLARA